MHGIVAGGERLDPISSSTPCAIVHYQINAVLEPLSSVIGFAALGRLRNENTREQATSSTGTSSFSTSSESSSGTLTTSKMGSIFQDRRDGNADLMCRPDGRLPAESSEPSSLVRVDVDATVRAMPMATTSTSPADRRRVTGEAGAPCISPGEPLALSRKIRSVRALSPEPAKGFRWGKTHDGKLETEGEQESRRRCRVETKSQRISGAPLIRRVSIVKLIIP